MTPVASEKQYIRRFPGPTKRLRPKIAASASCPRVRPEERLLGMSLKRSNLEIAHDSMHVASNLFQRTW